MNNINYKIKLEKKVYESKKARDILDEEFTEFGSIKRNTNEFFNIYNNKFYNIDRDTHKFFSEKSLQYVVDYVNPKKLQVWELENQKERIQIEIDSVEQFHPIFPNNVILTAGGDGSGNNNSYTYYLIQSGKRRRITSMELVYKIKGMFRQKGQRKEWANDVGSDVIGGIPPGPRIETNDDINLPLYTINTGKTLPSNIYGG